MRSETKLTALAVVLISVLSGCALLPFARTVNDIAQDQCEEVLEKRDDVAKAAKARGFSTSQWVEALCGVSDILEIFLTENPSSAPKMTQQEKGERAVAIAKEKGLL
jgi:membrane-bound lytic murein transglycosylase B